MNMIRTMMPPAAQTAPFGGVGWLFGGGGGANRIAALHEMAGAPAQPAQRGPWG